MKALRRFLVDDSGSATIELLFVLPIITFIFMAAAEASLFMMRHVMLERSVDLVVREIRLGRLDGTTHAALKRLICQQGVMEVEQTCVDSMRIWMQPISTVNFAMVVPPHNCIDRTEDIESIQEPTGTEFAYGVDNNIMLLRICLKEKPMFPLAALGARMIADETDGNYALVTTSVFVNEPD